VANSVYIGMSAAMASEARLQVVANNVANVSTAGFRGQRVAFQDVLVATLDGRPAEKGFAQAADTAIDDASGPLEHTGNPLDVAIRDDGYFVVSSPQGFMATRAGSFQTDVEGTLVDPSGRPVMAGGPPDAFSPIRARPGGGPVSVLDDGTIMQDGTALAQLAVVQVDAANLTPAGGSHLIVERGAMRPVQTPDLAVGYVEGSNVNAIRGMVELIEVSRDYQNATKMMSEARRLDQKLMTR